MRVLVQNKGRAQRIDVEVLDHDCYETNNYVIEEFTYYRPTQQQIDQGTDRDEKGLVAVCQAVLANGEICGKDMPNIDVWAETDDLFVDDREED